MCNVRLLVGPECVGETLLQASVLLVHQRALSVLSWTSPNPQTEICLLPCAQSARLSCCVCPLVPRAWAEPWSRVLKLLLPGAWAGSCGRRASSSHAATRKVVSCAPSRQPSAPCPAQALTSEQWYNVWLVQCWQTPQPALQSIARSHRETCCRGWLLQRLQQLKQAHAAPWLRWIEMLPSQIAVL